MGKPVTQDWVHELAMMQQSVLLSAIRGPDGIAKYHVSKYLMRWLRRCVLLSALDNCVWTDPYSKGGGSFTGPSFEPTFEVNFSIWEETMDRLVGEYLRAVDEVPHHFHMHLIHAAEVLGYKHPNRRISDWWRNTYYRFCKDLHLTPETVRDMEKRLGDKEPTGELLTILRHWHEVLDMPVPVGSTNKKRGPYRNSWTAEEDAKLKKLHAKGIVTKQIAFDMGRSLGAVKRRIYNLKLPYRSNCNRTRRFQLYFTEEEYRILHKRTHDLRTTMGIHARNVLLREAGHFRKSYASSYDFLPIKSRTD